MSITTTLDRLTDEQKAAVSALQRAIVTVNQELAAVAKVGIVVEMSTIDISTMGDRARRLRLTASITETPFIIA